MTTLASTFTVRTYIQDRGCLKYRLLFGIFLYQLISGEIIILSLDND